jgi:hypothetical protein
MPVDHHACSEHGQVFNASFTKICAIAAESPSIAFAIRVLNLHINLRRGMENEYF